MPFDRTSYQREYMRRRRHQAKKATSPLMTPVELLAIIGKLRLTFSRQWGVMVVCAELERRLSHEAEKRRDR
jgi:hypothetical protein